MKRFAACDSSTAALSIPACLAAWMEPFRHGFTRPVWDHVLVLVAGTILATGPRTVCAALRAMGRGTEQNFTNYHRVLNRCRWSSLDMARRLLALLVAAFARSGPLVLGIDDTIERRWGPKIKARRIYRDPVRSSRGHFVKTSGLRWLAVMLLVPIPWANRVWALPFLTVLAPSERYDTTHDRRHKKLTDWARQALLQCRRWLPGRRIVVVADNAYSSLNLIASLRDHLCLITRLRLDANLFDPPAPRHKGTMGRPALKGQKHKKLSQRLRAWPESLKCLQ